MGMLPLDWDQWKEEALEEILPPYVNLLRVLVARLRDDECGGVLPLFLCWRRQPRGRIRGGGGGAAIVGAANGRDDDNDGAPDPPTKVYLPLLYALGCVFCSPLGTKLRDSEGRPVRMTAMNVILNLAGMTDPEVRLVLVRGADVGDADCRSPPPLSSSSSFPMTRSPSLAPSLPPFPSATSHPLTIKQELLFPHVCNGLK